MQDRNKTIPPTLAAADHLLARGKPDEALALYRALGDGRADGRLWQRQGTALLLLSRAADAADALRRALQLDATNDHARHHLAVALNLLRQHDEATTLFETLLRRHDCDPDLLHHAGRAFRDLGDLDRARSLGKAAMALAPTNAKYHFGYAISELMAGNWAEGWRAYRHRWLGWDRQGVERPPKTPLPPWLGEVPSDEAGLLVFAEQGYGDCLQFSRYVIETMAVFKHVRFRVPLALHRLLARSLGPRIEVVTESDGHYARSATFTYHASLLDLPLLLDMPRPGDTPLSRGAYLRADPDLITKWKRLLPVGASRIGFVWAGGRQTAVNGRDLDLSDLTPLLTVPNLHFVSLQKDYRVSGGTVIDPLAAGGDFDETAAIVANLDLIVSADTAVAHLSAALGRPTWLLNRYESEWRWGRNQESSGWYPTLRIFSQPTPGDWGSVVERVCKAIAAS